MLVTDVIVDADSSVKLFQTFVKSGDFKVVRVLEHILFRNGVAGECALEDQAATRLIGRLHLNLFQHDLYLSEFKLLPFFLLPRFLGLFNSFLFFNESTIAAHKDDEE